MYPLTCPHCQEELQVPNYLSGCLIRCPDCDGVVRAPEFDLVPGDEEGSEPTYVLKQPVVHHERPGEVQDFLRDLEQKAKEEAEKKPYHRGGVSPDLIAGLLFIAAGVALFLLAFFSDLGALGMFVCGILLPMLPIGLGVMCLMAWDRSGGGSA